MSTERTLVAAGILATLLFAPWHQRAIMAMSAPLPPGSTSAPDACTLLTQSLVSSALEIESLPGKHAVASSSTTCIWSDDPNDGLDNRRLTLTITPVAGFDLGKTKNRFFTVEPASGIGDDAYYEVFRADSPALCVKKGSSAFMIRILNGLKAKPFSIEAVKTKEADLAKAVASKL